MMYFPNSFSVLFPFRFADVVLNCGHVIADSFCDIIDVRGCAPPPDSLARHSAAVTLQVGTTGFDKSAVACPVEITSSDFDACCGNKHEDVKRRPPIITAHKPVVFGNC